MDAASELATISVTNATTTTIIHTSPNAFNVNQSNNHIHTHSSAHSVSNSLTNKAASKLISSSGSSSSNSSNSSCSSSSTSSNSSGYGSTTTTPTNNYDIQQITPTTTPIPTTPVAISEHIIPVATVAAVTPFYNESVTTNNLEANHIQHHYQQSQQQQQQLLQQQQQHHLLPTNHHQFPQNSLQANIQQQHHHHQYLPRQQYYPPYDYQQPTATHNLSGTSATPAIAPYNVIIPGSYELSSHSVASSYGAIDSTNFERSNLIKTNAASPIFIQQQQQQPDQDQSKLINQQTQHFQSSSKQRSSLIGNSVNTNTSKPQATATPFYANPTPFYDNFKHKTPLEYHDTYANSSPATAATYHQQQNYYAAAKSQLKETSYVSPNVGNFYPGPAGGLNLPSATYDKYMFPHTSPTGYSTTTPLGNETPAEVCNYRKPIVKNAMNSPSWPWGLDYVSGNSRCIPPPTNHLPTATVAPTHTTNLAQNSAVLSRDTYFMGHEKYGMKYDKYVAPSYQQSFVSPPANRHMWPNTPHASNITQLNERHLNLPSHGPYTAPYFPNNSATGLNSRESCCSQPYQPQSCYYPPAHPVPPRLSHSQTPAVPTPTAGYLTAQQTLGQSPHLNALSASCKYGGVLPDYGGGNKIKNSNDLFLNTHHYNNNPTPHNFGHGTVHNSQPLYASNAHQSMAHGPAPSSLFTNNPLNANPMSFTNDLSLTRSNFDNYHTHLDTHPGQQGLSRIHNQEPPLSCGPTVAKRALLDYRKPIQPQPPPTIAEDCYTGLTSRDHYSQQELLNTPEVATFGEYHSHQNTATTDLSTLTHATAVQAVTERSSEECHKNLSLRDFIANWNDDEDEYQNNEEINFDQATVINEVLQTAPIEQEVAAVAVAVAVAEANPMKSSPLDFKSDVENIQECVEQVENISSTISEAEANQYVNLPDIVIDIEKSNNVNNSIITPTTSPASSPKDETSDGTILNLNNFDVEKELDELNLKKPAQQEFTKDFNNTKDVKVITSPQLSPCKNLATQLCFEDLNIETHNKTALSATRSAHNHCAELSEQQCLKDIEGYESSSSRHSNESAFEKEYETFINKISSESAANTKVNNGSSSDNKISDFDKEIDFAQNVHDFSKFYKRKRKLKEDEFKTSLLAMPSRKKFKATVTAKKKDSNFPQVYTRKARNRWNKTNLQSSRKRKPLSAYYKIIHSIRRFGLYREKRVRAYMADLKEKHLPLIKRRSIKNYTHEISRCAFSAKSLKSLCITVINTDEFRQNLLLMRAEREDATLDSEEKHICTDPACDTCEVINSLMEADNFESALMQQVAENQDASTAISTAIFCTEGNTESIIILEDASNIIDLNLQNEKQIMISNELKNVQYSEQNFPSFDAKDLGRDSLNSIIIKSFLTENEKSKINISSENSYEGSKWSNLDLHDQEQFDSSPQSPSEIAEHTNSETSLIAVSEKFVNASKDQADALESGGVSPNNEFHNQTEQFSVNRKYESTIDVEKISSELNMFLEETSKTVRKEADLLNTNEISAPTADENSSSDSEDTDSSETETDSSSSDTEDSKDSYKNSNNNSEGSDTDGDGDLNGIDNTDSNQSHQSIHLKSDNNTGINGKNELLQPIYSMNYESNQQQLSPSHAESRGSVAIVNDTRNKAEDYTQPELQTETNTDDDSDSECEIPTRSPQRIVIRITKSSSPNDQSLRVENVFGKPLKAHTHTCYKSTESETRGDEIVKKKSEKFEIQENYLDVCVHEKSGEIQKDVEDKAIDKMVSAPLKLIIKKDKFLESGKNLESKPENDSICENESEVNAAILKLKQKQEDSIEKNAHEISMQQLEENKTNMNLIGKTSEIYSELSNSKDLLEVNLELNDFLSEEPSNETLGLRTENNKLNIIPKPLELCSKMGNFKKDEASETLVETVLELENVITKENYGKGSSRLNSPTQDAKEENKALQITAKSHITSTQEHDKTKFVKLSPLLENLDDANILNKLEDDTDAVIPETCSRNLQFNSEENPSPAPKIEEKKPDSASLLLGMSEKYNNFKEETFSEKSKLINAGICSLSGSESGLEGEGELDNGIDFHSDNQAINMPDSANYPDSEYETNDSEDTFESIRKLNVLTPINISGEESIDDLGFVRDLQTVIKPEDSLQQFKIVSDLVECLTDDDSETQKEYIRKGLVYEANSFDLEQVDHLKFKEQSNDENEAVVPNHKTNIEINEFCSDEIQNGEKSSKTIENPHIDQDNYLEHFSEQSSSSVEPSEEEEVKNNTGELQRQKEQQIYKIPETANCKLIENNVCLIDGLSEADGLTENTAKEKCETIETPAVRKNNESIEENRSKDLDNLLEVEELNNLQNEIQEKFLADNECGSPNSETFKKAKTHTDNTDNLNPILPDDNSNESELSTILEDTECSASMPERKQNIAQAIIEAIACNKKIVTDEIGASTLLEDLECPGPMLEESTAASNMEDMTEDILMPENKRVALEDRNVRSRSLDIDMDNFEAKTEEVHLADSESMCELTKFLGPPLNRNSDFLVNCNESSAIIEESMSKSATSDKDTSKGINDHKRTAEPKMESINTLSKANSENPSNSTDINEETLAALNESNTENKVQKSETISQTVSKDSSIVPSEEMFGEISHQGESSTAYKIKESEDAFQTTIEMPSSSATNNLGFNEDRELTAQSPSEKLKSLAEGKSDDLDVKKSEKTEVENIFEIKSVEEKLSTETANTMATLNAITEITELTQESDLQLSTTVAKISTPCLELHYTPQYTKPNKGECSKKIIDREKSELKNAVSTRPLADIIESEENVSLDVEIQKENVIPDVSQETKLFSESLIEKLDISPRELKVFQKEKFGESCENIDKNLRIEINDLFQSNSSNNLAEVPETKEKEEELLLDDTEISESCEEDKEAVETTKTLANEKSKAEQPTETFKEIFNENENVIDKDCISPENLNENSCSFKYQSRFDDDESEAFHGFEDFEEVTRIRQEIENLKDECNANDGFPTNHSISATQALKSPKSSMSDSINELEALEKELSQHQPEIQLKHENLETEQNLPIKPLEEVSSNDIEHIKQMLESDEELQTCGQGKIKELAHTYEDLTVESSENNQRDIREISSINSVIPKLSDLCRAALNSSLSSNSNLAQQHTDTPKILMERELSVEETLAEMYRQAGVLLSDAEDCDNEIPAPGSNEANDVLLINLQEILNSDNNEVYVLQCDMNENILNVMQSVEDQQDQQQDNGTVNAERVNAVQIFLDTQNTEPQIHIISSDSESEVIILSDDESDFSYRLFTTRDERVVIPFINDEDDINDSDSLFDISTIHHEEIVPDNLNKFLEEEFYKYLHEKYVQRNISKYYHANRVLKKYKKRYVRNKRQ